MHLQKLIAWKVQYPNVPWHILTVMYSKTEGTGKDTLGKFLEALLGSNHSHEYKRAKDFFEESFNGHLEHTLIVRLPELGERGELVKYINQLKAGTTTDRLSINNKGLSLSEVYKFFDVIGCTNFKNFMHGPTHSRRLFALHVDEVAHDRAYWTGIYTDFADPDYVKAAWDYYNAMDLKGFDPHTPFDTKFKQTRQTGDMPPWLEFLIAKAEGTAPGTTRIMIGISELYAEFTAWYKATHGEFLKLSQRTFRDNIEEAGFKESRPVAAGRQCRVFVFEMTALEAVVRKESNPAYQFTHAVEAHEDKVKAEDAINDYSGLEPSQADIAKFIDTHTLTAEQVAAIARVLAMH
jgi:phage/plasmid-associated DNA primase